MTKKKKKVKHYHMPSAVFLGIISGIILGTVVFLFLPQ